MVKFKLKNETAPEVQEAKVPEAAAAKVPEVPAEVPEGEEKEEPVKEVTINDILVNHENSLVNHENRLVQIEAKWFRIGGI